METNPEPREPIISELAHDPDLKSLVAEFTQSLPAKAEAMKQELARGDIETLTRLAHQLKGSAGGYGYPTITKAARQLEETAKTTQDMEALSAQVRELADLCKRAVSPATEG